MGSFTRILRLMSPVVFATVVTGVTTTVSCKKYIKDDFDKVFSITLLVRDTVVAVIDASAISKPNTSLPISVYNVKGDISGSVVYLSAVLKLECDMVDAIKCSLFGIPVNLKDFKILPIMPNTTCKDTITNMTADVIPVKGVYGTGDRITIKCSAQVRSANMKWYFKANAVILHNDVSSTSRRYCCCYNVTAFVHFVIDAKGEILINCGYGKQEVGRFSIEAVDMHEILSFHLLLSSMLLVYCPFVIMPFMWSFFAMCSQTLRNPEIKIFKVIRTLFSFLDWILFSIWWIWVTCHYRHSKEITSYSTFAVIEATFLVGYAIYRSLFVYLEKEGNWFGEKRAYNSRVTTSHGAVMTPIICWLMIRVPYHLPFYVIEVFFWIISCGSTLFFAFVSHQREYDDWTKKQN